MDGRLRRGGNGRAMEVGHMPVSKPGDKKSPPWDDSTALERNANGLKGFYEDCWCKERLHVDTFATPSRIKAELQIRLQKDDYQKAASSLGVDTVEHEIFRRAGSALGRALAHVCNIVNPSSLIIYLPTEFDRPNEESEERAAKEFDATAAGAYVDAAQSEIVSAFANENQPAKNFALMFEPLPGDPEELAILLARAAAACVFENFIEHAQKTDECLPH